MHIAAHKISTVTGSWRYTVCVFSLSETEAWYHYHRYEHWLGGDLLYFINKKSNIVYTQSDCQSHNPLLLVQLRLFIHL
jgi:hypothetical protein